MPRYRTKPCEIDAVKWDMDTKPSDLPGWLLKPLGLNPERFDPATGNLTIRTLDVDMLCKPGDYIVRGPEGELYPVKPSIFERKYELVE